MTKYGLMREPHECFQMSILTTGSNTIPLHTRIWYCEQSLEPTLFGFLPRRLLDLHHAVLLVRPRKHMFEQPLALTTDQAVLLSKCNCDADRT